MTLSSNSDDVIRRLGLVAGDLARIQGEGARQIAQRQSSLATANMKRISGDGRLSGVGKRGAKVGVQMRRRGQSNWQVRATGPWQLVEGNTKAHSLNRRRARRGRRQVYNTPWGFRARIPGQHPGTRGRYPWKTALDITKREAPGIYRRQIAASMQRRYSGRR